MKDQVHSFFTNTISRIFLAGRTIALGEWLGQKTICISFDCDFESDMLNLETLLSLLAKNNIYTSFAVVGTLAAKFPERIELLIKHGHEIVNHTLSHPQNFRDLSLAQKRREIEEFQKLMKKLFNYQPVGFRCPHLLHHFQEDLFDILQDQKIKYDSSILGNTGCKFGDITEVPLSPCPSHLYRPFDSYHHFYPALLSASAESFFKDFKKILEKNNFVNIYLDPRDISSKLSTKMLEDMISEANKMGFAFCTLHHFHSRINDLIF